MLSITIVKHMTEYDNTQDKKLKEIQACSEVR